MTTQQEKTYEILLELETEIAVNMFLNYYGIRLLSDDFIEFVKQETAY